MARYDELWMTELPLTNSKKKHPFCGVQVRERDISKKEVKIPETLEPFPKETSHELKYLLSSRNIVYSTDFPNTNTNTYLVNSIIRKGAIEIIPTGYRNSEYRRFYIIITPLLDRNKPGIYPSISTDVSERIGDLTELIPLSDVFLAQEFGLENELVARYI